MILIIEEGDKPSERVWQFATTVVRKVGNRVIVEKSRHKDIEQLQAELDAGLDHLLIQKINDIIMST